ncbi:MAG: hypothetical protein J4N36_07580 [Chloroflexi bacterium]|nr:hypothetical protein [Chloroflexota bacterium]MCI0815042.1 hypothetical protein [Chloroflexota bacterium]MCI0818386.1 hypothetical protein [Chloroflexota bacterium]MCI0819338.1 hypothetical protein [Chloroflexota bacterium]MCI0833098.1 hypothetical protein [Chloroflexota bacterium]
MTSELILSRLRRMIMLDTTVFPEVRDDRSFTPVVAGLAAAAVFAAGLGAFLYGQTVLPFTPDNWFLETAIMGSIFTIILLAASIALTYVVLAEIFKVPITLDGLGRVLALCYTVYAVSFFVFLPEIGFTFGMLSIAAMFYYAVSGVRAAAPEASRGAAVLSVGAGFVLWITVMALISDPGDNFFNGPFVYSIGD